MHWESSDIVLAPRRLHAETTESRGRRGASLMIALFIRTFQRRLYSNMHLEEKESKEFSSRQLSHEGQKKNLSYDLFYRDHDRV